MTGFTFTQDANYNGIKLDISSGSMGDIVKAQLYDTEGTDINFSMNVIGYTNSSGFEIPLADIQGDGNYKEALLKDNLQLVLNNSNNEKIKDIYITQQLPHGKLQSITPGKNKVTFQVEFDTDTFNNLNTSSPPTFYVTLTDTLNEFWGNTDGNVEVTLSSTKVSDGIYRATLEDASLNNGETYNLDILSANNNVDTKVQVDYNNVTRPFTPFDRPSELSVPSAVNTLALDGSNNRTVDFAVKKAEGDFNYAVAKYVLEVNDVTKEITLDVSNGQVVNPGNNTLIQDDATGSWNVSLKRTDALFNSIADGATFSLKTHLEGKVPDASGNPTGKWIKGAEYTKSNVKMNHPLASSDLVISEVKSNGDQVVQFELNQPLNAYFDSSAGLQLAKVYHVNVDASNQETGVTAIFDFKNILKQQIDASGSMNKVSVELTGNDLSNNSYGKKLRMVIHAYETNMKSGSDNKLSKTTGYNVLNCVPTDEASPLSFSNSTTDLTATLTWSDSSANVDRLRYYVTNTTNNTKIGGVVTSASGGSQQVTIENLTAGVKYEHSYIYEKKASGDEPYNTLIPSGYIQGAEKPGNPRFFFAKTAPLISSVTYALADCSSTEFTKIKVVGNAQGHSVKQFYVLVNSTDTEDVVKYKLVDASGLKDVCGNDLNIDAANNPGEAPTEFSLEFDMGASLVVFPQDKQMNFVVMDTSSTIDPVKYSAGADVNAATFGENYSKAKSDIDSYRAAYNKTDSAYTDASSNVDNSLNVLYGGNGHDGLLDASRNLKAENTYNVLVNNAKTAFATWYASDASHALAYTALNDASNILNSFITNFHNPANAKTSSLDDPVDNSALTAWNNMSPVNGIITKEVTVGTVTAKVEVDASRNVAYSLSGIKQNSNVPIIIDVSGVNTANILSDRIKSAFEKAKSDASGNLTTASATDASNYSAFKKAVSDRNTGYATYKDSYDIYSTLIDNMNNTIAGWNNNLSPSLNNLATLKSNFATSYQLWYESKLHYDCSENSYETIGTDASNVAIYNTFVSDLDGNKYILNQDIEDKIPLLLQSGEPNYTAIEFNPNPPTGYPDGWPKP